MRYLGGKTNIGRQISEVLKKYAPPDTVKGFVEPFCGSLGITVHMVDDYKRCYISDINKDLIMLWKELKAGTFKFPRDVSEQTWNRYKKSQTPSAMRAFIGFGCSFGGLWFCAYAQKYSQSNMSKHRNILVEAKNGCLRKQEKLKKVNSIRCTDYFTIKYPNQGGYLIYCDPPYQNTTKYRATDSFDTNKFWDTMRKWSENNIVIVSEYKAPRDFKCIWSKKKIETLSQARIGHEGRNHKSISIEKLFIHRKLYKKKRN